MVQREVTRYGTRWGKRQAVCLGGTGWGGKQKIRITTTEKKTKLFGSCLNRIGWNFIAFEFWFTKLLWVSWNGINERELGHLVSPKLLI